MVRLDERLEEIKRLYVNRGKYFVINRGRQYGKTTTLHALEIYLEKEYLVFSLDFQMLSTVDFKDEQTFAAAFISQMEDIFFRRQTLRASIGTETFEQLSLLRKQNELSLKGLFKGLSQLCEASVKPVVLMIDEVDNASNNQVFIDFLAQLRGYYLHRQDIPIFRAVILVGVYDIKNLKVKMRPNEEHQYNSPWNTREGNEGNGDLSTFNDCSRNQIAHVQFDVAASFDVAMDFSSGQIAEMLREYESDHQTGMDVPAVAEEIYQYTSGYPYLVSLVCKTIDETLQPQAEKVSSGYNWWTREGIAEAVNRIMKIKTPLFDSMAKQLDTYPDMREMLEDIIYQGKRIPFSPDTKSISMGVMFGFLKDRGSQVIVSNRIFEMRMLNMFAAEESVSNSAFRYGENNKPQFVNETGLNMELVLGKFVEYFTDIYGDNDEKFVEAYGRKFFLLYLKPIINGTGNYYLEAQTRDASRTDVIVDYLGEQYVVELKIWRRNEYNERGERQLAEYLDYYHLDKGYLLSFNFNKKKETGVKIIQVNGKVIVEAVV